MDEATAFVKIGRATLFRGDCYKLLRELGRFDALVTDPPYIIRTSGGGHFRKARGHTAQIAAEGLDQGFDLSIINPLQFGTAVAFCHNDQLADLLPHLRGCYERQVVCFWRKTNPMPVANKHYQPDSEIWVHAWSGDYFPRGDLADKKRVWEGAAGRRAEFGHPTVKPLDLMRKIVRNTAGDSICDPFMGTGTTGVAAIEAGRSFIGIEHNPVHWQTAVDRITQAVEKAQVHAMQET